MRITVREATAALLVLGTAGCDLFGPSGSGVLIAQVLSPYGLEGAMVVELEGGVGLGPVTSGVGDTYFEHGPTVSRIVIVLDVPGEIRFTVRTQDIGELPELRVVEVADAENRLRSSVDGYEVVWEQREDFSSAPQVRAP